MRTTHPFDELFHGRVAVRVLRTLSLFPTKEFTGRELAREAGVPHSKAIDELNRLLEHGVVERRTAGRSQLWKLRPSHLFVAPLRALFEFEAGLERDLRHRLARSLSRIPEVERAVLFGSTARGEAGPRSDVDLLVVVRTARGKEAFAAEFKRIRSDLERRFGSRIQPLVYSSSEWKRKKGLPLAQNVDREGKIVWERRE